MINNRPKLKDVQGACLTATTMDANMIELLGQYARQDGVAFTAEQVKNLKKIYDFDESDDNILTQAGDQRNLMRYVQADGMRVMAFLARYLEPGEDPVRVVQDLFMQTGFDVPDFDWDYKGDEDIL